MAKSYRRKYKRTNRRRIKKRKSKRIKKYDKASAKPDMKPPNKSIKKTMLPPAAKISLVGTIGRSPALKKTRAQIKREQRLKEQVDFNVKKGKNDDDPGDPGL